MNNDIPPSQHRPLALVLLVLTFILAGCDNDDCDFTPPPASLTVTVTAYSLADGSVLHARQETIVAPTDDGTLPAREKTYASPDVKGYLLAEDQTVQLPAVSRGQQVHFSVSFFLPSVFRLVEKSEGTVVASTPVGTETDEVIDFTFIPGTSEEIEFTVKAESRITNIDEVLEYIEGLFPQTRGTEDEKKIKEALIECMTPGFQTKSYRLKRNRDEGYWKWVESKMEDIAQLWEGEGNVFSVQLRPNIEEVNRPITGEGNSDSETRIEISREYITVNETYSYEAVIQGKLYVVENIKVEAVRTEVKLTYLNAGGSGQIGDWKPVTGEGVVD